MPMPPGAEAYQAHEPPVVACGVRYTPEEVGAVLDTSVGALARDGAGAQQLADFLTGVADTEFKSDALRRAFDSRPQLEDWRVGEMIAEAYLADHRRCVFPWPTARDLRDSNASLPGTDLVGFQQTDEPAGLYRLVFAEVKTSNDSTIPPSVMYGRHGLKLQLEELRDSQSTRDTLFLYLAWRAITGVPWGDKYRRAAARYLADSADVAIFGVLVRDVTPDRRDLRGRARSLARGCPTSMHVELIAIYLPPDTIKGLGARVAGFVEGDHANN